MHVFARCVACVDSVIAAWTRDIAADSRSVKFRVVEQLEHMKDRNWFIVSILF